jgi:hypothetical protein
MPMAKVKIFSFTEENEELLKKFEEYAQKERKSESSVLREALSQYLETKLKPDNQLKLQQSKPDLWEIDTYLEISKYDSDTLREIHHKCYQLLSLSEKVLKSRGEDIWKRK